MPNVGDAGGLQPSAVAGNLYVCLYTSDPTDSDAGVEAAYTGYARKAVPRSVLGWDVTGNVASNVDELLFPVNTGAQETISHWAIRSASAAGDLVGSGALTGTVDIDPGDTPRCAAGLCTVTEN